MSIETIIPETNNVNFEEMIPTDEEIMSVEMEESCEEESEEGSMNEEEVNLSKMIEQGGETG